MIGAPARLESWAAAGAQPIASATASATGARLARHALLGLSRPFIRSRFRPCRRNLGTRPIPVNARPITSFEVAPRQGKAAEYGTREAGQRLEPESKLQTMMLDTARRLITPSARSDVPPFMVMDVMAAAARIEAQGGRVIDMEGGQPAAPAPAW